MFHPGIIIEVFKKEKNVKSKDSSVQAALEMWDENIVTMNVNSKIADNLKKGDLVLADYNPVSDKVAVPRFEVVKILKGTKGKDMWNKYKAFLRKKKPQTRTIKVQKPSQQYIG